MSNDQDGPPQPAPSRFPVVLLELWLGLALLACFFVSRHFVPSGYQLGWREVTHHIPAFWLFVTGGILLAAVFLSAWFAPRQLSAFSRSSVRNLWWLVPLLYLGLWVTALVTKLGPVMAACIHLALLCVTVVPYLVARALLARGLSVGRVCLAGFVLLISLNLLMADAAYYQVYQSHLGRGELWFLFNPPGREGRLDIGMSTALRHTVTSLTLVAICLWPTLLPSLRQATGTRPWRLWPCAAFAGLMLLGQHAFFIKAPLPHRVEGFRKALPYSLVAVETRPQAAITLQRHLDELLDGFALRSRVGKVLQEYEQRSLVVAPDRRFDVLIICIEALRSDMLVKDYMPRLSGFAKRAETWSPHFTCSSGTVTSVFSLIHGLPPFYRRAVRQGKVASLLGSQLRQAGYDVRRVARSPAKYALWRDTVFRDFELLDLGVSEETVVAGLLADELRAARKAQRPLAAYWHIGNTHWPYRFDPEDIRFRPYIEHTKSVSPSILRSRAGEIRNRYLNAVVHADRAFGVLLDGLDAMNAWDSCIVVITGDHGEEFFETGRVFHGSAANRYQDEVPLVFWSPDLLRSERPPRSPSFTQHSDVTARIFSVLSGETVTPFGTNRQGDHHEFAFGQVGYGELVWYRSRQFSDCVVLGTMTNEGFHVLDLEGQAPEAAKLRTLAEQLASHLEAVLPGH